MGCSRGHHTERGEGSIGAGTCACARAYPRARHALCLEAQAGPSTGVSLPQAPVAGKGSSPASQPPIPLAATSSASYAAASSSLRPNQRIRVWWDNKTYYDDRVIDTRSELGRGGVVQQRFQVAYDDGERHWHVCDVASGVRVELLAEEVCEEAVCDEWLPLELR